MICKKFVRHIAAAGLGMRMVMCVWVCMPGRVCLFVRGGGCVRREKGY